MLALSFHRRTRKRHIDRLSVVRYPPVVDRTGQAQLKAASQPARVQLHLATHTFRDLH